MQLSKSATRLTSGQKILSLYFVLFYFIPLIGNFLFRDKIYTIYKVEPISLFVVINIFFIFVTFLWLTVPGRFQIKAHRESLLYEKLHKFCSYWGQYYSSKRLYIALVFFVCGAYFYIQGLSSYRYEYVGISERGSYFLMFSILVSNYVIVDLFFQMFISKNRDITYLSRRWFSNVFMALAAVSFADGTSSSFLALLACFYAFFPSLFNRLWFLAKTASSTEKIVQFAKVLPICIILFLLAWTQGEFIKVSSGKVKAADEQRRLVVMQQLQLSEQLELGEQLPVYRLLRHELVAEILSGNRVILGGLIHYNTFLARRRQAVIIGYYDRLERGLKRLFTEGRLFGDRSKKEQKILHKTKLRPLSSGGSFSQRIFDKLQRKLEFLKYGQGEIFSMKYIYYLVERFSSHLYSYMHTVSVPFSELQWKQAKAVTLPLRSMLFRADYVMGGFFAIEKPVVASVSQLNYRLLVKDSFKPREGTSPGLLGSFNYISPWPISIFLTLIYLIFLTQIFSHLFSNIEGQQISLLGLILVLHVFQNFMDSPVDFLLVIDNSFLKIIVVFCIYLGLNYKRSSSKLAT